MMLSAGLYVVQLLLITGMTRKTPSTARTLASVIAAILVYQVSVENALYVLIHRYSHVCHAV